MAMICYDGNILDRLYRNRGNHMDIIKQGRRDL